jgi:hypothetical protein
VSERLGEIGETLARLMKQLTSKRLGKVLIGEFMDQLKPGQQPPEKPEPQK